MSERMLSICGPSNHRYVSKHAAHRICRVFFTLALLVPSGLFAEADQGTIVELTEEAELYKEANPGSGSYGLLPKGTLLRLMGDQEGKFVSVEVELQQGLIEGWVYRNRLNLEEQAREELLEESETKEKPKSKKVLTPRSRRPAPIPKDEGALLRRKPTFFYGPNAGGLFSVIRAIDGDIFTGIGFGVGGHIGFFIAPDIPVRLELEYASLNGTGSLGDPVSFGFFNVGGSIAYHMNDLELYGRVSYAIGVGVSNLPNNLNEEFDTVAGLSSIWVGGGIGYRLAFNEITHVTIRGLYSVSLLQTPFNYQIIGLQLFLDLQG